MDSLGKNATIGYCTNVHPGATWSEVKNNISHFGPKIRSLLLDSRRFGLGLWLSEKTLRELLHSEQLQQFKNLRAEYQLNFFSFNGFPLLDFHGETIKEQVYKPDWRNNNRLDYTLNLISFIEHIGTSSQELSISTLPIGYRSEISDPLELNRVASNLAKVAAKAFQLELDSGIQVHLDLEPEPYCYLETHSDVVQFFQEYLLTYGVEEISESLKITPNRASEIILDKIRVCYDTCHAAVMFENPKTILDDYNSLGIRIGKVQVSSALHLDHTAEVPWDLLETLSADRYLHQVMGSDPHISFSDIPGALQKWKQTKPNTDFRIHYHVPIFLKYFHNIKTTQDHILQLLDISQTQFITSHWEIETYTWPSLTKSGYPGDLSFLIAQELNWFKSQLSKTASKETDVSIQQN